MSHVAVTMHFFYTNINRTPIFFTICVPICFSGNFWIIHPANVDDFSQGDFRRRMARIKVRQSKSLSQPQLATVPSSNGVRYDAANIESCAIAKMEHDSKGWVPMTQWTAPVTSLVQMFGPQAVLSRQEMLDYSRMDCDNAGVIGDFHPKYAFDGLSMEDNYSRLALYGYQAYSLAERW